MFDTGKLRRDIDDLDKVTGKDKLARAKNILVEINKAEMEIARDYSIPFDSVRAIRNMVPVVLGTIARLEAARKKARA